MDKFDNVENYSSGAGSIDEEPLEFEPYNPLASPEGRRAEALRIVHDWGISSKNIIERAARYLAFIEGREGQA